MAIEVSAKHVEPFLPDHLESCTVMETLESTRNGETVGHVIRQQFCVHAVFYPHEECDPLTADELNDIRKLLKVYSK